MESVKFKEALRSNNIEKIKKIAKTDFHNHSGLGMRFSNFEKFANEKVTPPPKSMNGIKGLDEYMMNVTMKYVIHRKGFEFSLKACIEDAIADGVVILEASIDCSGRSYYDTKEDYYAFINDCVHTYKEKIDFRPEIGVAKGIPEDIWKTNITEDILSGTFKSIDLYGEEEIYYPDRYKKYLKLCKENNVKVKFHIGEFCDSKKMIEVIKELDPDEIQHGINCYLDDECISLIKEKDIILHICPTSNEILGAVKSVKEHPVRVIYDKGIKLTINTDDLLLFDSGVSDEYLKLYNEGVFNEDELDIIRQNSLKY